MAVAEPSEVPINVGCPKERSIIGKIETELEFSEDSMPEQG